jgi:hypothetical protein
VGRRRGRDALAQHPVVHVDARWHPVLLRLQVPADHGAAVALAGPARVLRRHPGRSPGVAGDKGPEVDDLAPLDVLPQPPVVQRARCERRPPRQLAAHHREHSHLRPADERPRVPVIHRQQDRHLPVADPAKQRAVPRQRHALGDHPVAGDGHRRAQADLLALALAPVPRAQREVLARILGKDVKAGSFEAAVPQDDRTLPAAGIARRR